MEGATYEEKLKNYLISMGVSSADLQVQPAIYDNNGKPISRHEDKDGNMVWSANKENGNEYDLNGDGKCSDDEWEAYNNRASENVAWLNEAATFLQGGVTNSIQFNFNAAGKTTATFCINGQAQYTYAAQRIPVMAADGTMNGEQLYKVQEYKYTDNGFLIEVVSNTFDVIFNGNPDADKYRKEKDAWLANNPTKENGDLNTEADYIAHIEKNKDSDAYKHYEAYNKAISENQYTYGLTQQITKYNEYGQPSHVVDADGNVQSVYTYGINGSLLQVESKVNGTITTFVNGQAYNTFNSQGGLIQATRYHANGLMDYTDTYNNGTPVTRTVYSRNFSLGTFSMQNATAAGKTPDQLRAVIAEIRNATTEQQIQEIAQKNGLISMDVYASDLNNAALMKYMLNPAGTTTDATAAKKSMELALAVMHNNNNGYLPIGKATFVYGKTGETKYTFNGKDYASKEELAKAMYEQDKADGSVSPSWVMNEDGSINVDSSFKKMNANSGNYSGWSGPAITSTTGDTTNTIKFSVYAEGQPVFDIQNTIVVEKGKTDTIVKHDPAVVGVVNSIVGENGETVVMRNGKAYIIDGNGDEVEYTGKTYAKLSATGVNMMDGSGFQAADGEEIYVEVSLEQAAALEIGGEAMFMGDVSKSEDGKYVMTINTNYNVTVNGRNYKGMVTGADVQAAKADIQAESEKAITGESKYGWMNTNTAQNRGIFGLVNPTQFLNDWRDGWAALAGWNK
jgi:hypothetical protein